MNIAIFSPNQNPYSETFIQAHKNYLKGNVFYYFGRKSIQLEGNLLLASGFKRKLLALEKRLLKKDANFIRDTLLLNSLKRNKIAVILVEYGNHAAHLLPLLQKSKLP